MPVVGAAYLGPGWTFGTASEALTRAYNPQGYLDAYFLLGSSGRVAYVGSAPASAMSQLLGPRRQAHVRPAGRPGWQTG